ncbi:MAG: EF-hand domain-containing protein [Planctomycetota bacterium]|nr:EF-hand domain-containing protein [Planctomycetota bacterium]
MIRALLGLTLGVALLAVAAESSPPRGLDPAVSSSQRGRVSAPQRARAPESGPAAPRGQTAPPRDDTARELPAPFGVPPEAEQRRWFTIADADATEWISFREARASMRFDAARFREYDLDNDGRMSFEEFKDFIRSERRLGREVTEPLMARPDGPPPARNAEQLRAAYDTDLDGFINRIEIDLMFLDYGRDQESIDSALVIQRLDLDGDGKLGISELSRLATFLAPLGEAAAEPQRPDASTVDDLFGKPIDMGEANAPRIIGPVSPFRRLDVDNDGFVTIDDLERLEGRSFSAMSLESVLNTLDLDADGKLSEAEFLSSMTRR